MVMTPKEYEAMIDDEKADLRPEKVATHTSAPIGAKRGRILAEKALKTINGDRQDSYGAPEDSFGLIGRYWSTYLGVEIDGADVALMMALFKVAREQNGKGSHADNVVDLVGYSLLYGDIVGYGA